MKTIQTLAVFGALAASTSSFAADCRAIFEPGFSKQAQAFLKDKFEVIDEEKVEDSRVIPFRIVVMEDLDVDPETLTLKLLFKGAPIVESKYDSEGFIENILKTKQWMRDLPTCAEVYRSRS